MEKIAKVPEGTHTLYDNYVEYKDDMSNEMFFAHKEYIAFKFAKVMDVEEYNDDIWRLDPSYIEYSFLEEFLPNIEKLDNLYTFGLGRMEEEIHELIKSQGCDLYLGESTESLFIGKVVSVYELDTPVSEIESVYWE